MYKLPDKCKFALLYLNEIKYDDMAWEFACRDYDAEIIDTGVSIYSNDPKDADRISQMLKNNGVDIAFTMDFSPAVSMACMACRIRYVSWVYDSPQEGLYDQQIQNECNYIFTFDKVQTEETRIRGAKNIYHLPLATNAYRNLRLVIDKKDEEKFSCDISFAGSLYANNFYDTAMARTSSETRKEIDDILGNAFGKWDGTDHIRRKLTDRALDELWEIVSPTLPDNYPVDRDEYFCSMLMARYLSFKERTNIVAQLADHGIRLYTGDQNVIIPKVTSRGQLSYDEELPKLYYLSRINLNVTLHSISSGIPLRVFDIMGVGGFMLTNYQPEIEDIFEVGRNIEVYHSIDELKDKVDYYLKHEEARQRIALNGYKTVSEKHNYSKRLDYILDKIF